MKNFPRIFFCALIIGLCVTIVACATVPHASPADDAAAKGFLTNRAKAGLYIFRQTRFYRNAEAWDVSLDGRTLALLTPGTFVYCQVAPGEHTLHRLDTVLPIHVEAGKNYFVRENVVFSITGGAWLSVVSESVGQAEVRSGQRVVTLF